MKYLNFQLENEIDPFYDFSQNSAPSPQTFSLIFETARSLSRDLPPSSKCFLKRAMVCGFL